MNKIDHIGIATKSINDSKSFYEKILGLKLISEEIINEQKVKAAIFEIGETHIELLEPTEIESPINKFIEKKGTGIHHIAIEVDDIEKKLIELKNKGYKLIDEIPKTGAGGNKIAFVHPKDTGGVLIELIMKKKD